MQLMTQSSACYLNHHRCI